MLPKLQIPDDHLKALGLVIVEWNRLEQMLDCVIVSLMGYPWGDPRGNAICVHSTFPQKWQVLQVLLSFMPSTSYPTIRLTPIIPELEKFNKKRNELVHTKWALIEGVVKTGSVTARKKVAATSNKIEVQELVKFSDEIRRVSSTLFQAINFKGVPAMRAEQERYADILNPFVDKH